jgi:hypothetical protein
VVVLPEDRATPCPLCGKPVRDAVSALCYGQDRAPAHFDCVLESLRSRWNLAPDERLCYLGGGAFGVIRSPQGEGHAPFSIRERVPYEAEPDRPEWRVRLDAVATSRRRVSDQGASPLGDASEGRDDGPKDAGGSGEPPQPAQS